MVSSANGSQTDHGLGYHLKKTPTKVAGTLVSHRVIPCGGRSNLYGLRLSQSSNFRIADYLSECRFVT
jgi:hypothetical protein